MRKLLGGLILSVFITQSWAEAPYDERQQQLVHLLKHDCGSCHGLTLKGGLGSSLLAEDIKDKDDAFLVATILNGRQGTAMPPWRDFVSEHEAQWLVSYLRQNR
jgi:cytochrome c55X